MATERLKDEAMRYPDDWLKVVCVCDQCRIVYRMMVSPRDLGPWCCAKLGQSQLQSLIYASDRHPKGPGRYKLCRCSLCSLRGAAPTLRRAFADILARGEEFTDLRG